MIQVKTAVTVLSAVSKPYNFDGKSGTSHKIRVMAQGEIYNCYSNEDQVKDAQSRLNKEVTANLFFTSPKENLKVEVGFLE